jgi:hypothetical protein
MKLKSSHIRLLVASAASMVSAVFVATYSALSVPIAIARDHMSFDRFPYYTQWLANFCWYALLIPACLLAAGVFILMRWKNKAAFEVAVGFQWLFALIWLACGLLVCSFGDYSG